MYIFLQLSLKLKPVEFYSFILSNCPGEQSLSMQKLYINTLIIKTTMFFLSDKHNVILNLRNCVKGTNTQIVA